MKQKYFLVTATFVLLAAIPLVSKASESEAAPSAGQEQSAKSTVDDWFAKYDQIRRNAELSLGERFQCRGMLERGLQHAKANDRNTTLAHKMESKYKAAASAMQDLPILPETTDLQNGYIEFFKQGHQLFLDCIGSEQTAPATGQVLDAQRKKLEVLDRKNKKLDEELRRKFGIARHKHI